MRLENYSTLVFQENSFRNFRFIFSKLNDFGNRNFPKKNRIFSGGKRVPKEVGNSQFRTSLETMCMGMNFSIGDLSRPPHNSALNISMSGRTFHDAPVLDPSRSFSDFQHSSCRSSLLPHGKSLKSIWIIIEDHFGLSHRLTLFP